MRQWRPMRAIIGDEIRVPILWCEFGTSCIAKYTDPNARDERDLRSRALAAGWRHDRLGRIACPDCARSEPGIQAGRPVRPDPAPGAGRPAQPDPGIRPSRSGGSLRSVLRGWFRRGGQPQGRR
jgi:hypothetical protein